MDTLTAEDWAGHSDERMMIALFGGLIVHAVILFAVGFHLPEAGQRIDTRMEIVLVQSKSAEAPDEADLLAQVNQDGGGESTEMQRASTPTLSEFPDPTPAITSASAPMLLAAQPKKDVKAQLTVKKSEQKIDKVKAIETPQDRPLETGLDLQTTPPTLPKLTASELILNARDTVASIQAELDAAMREFKDKPPHKYVSARTKAYAYAGYMDAWRIKVERLGQLNFPNEARRKRLSGTLIMDLALNANGTIHELLVLQPSTHKMLDDAAKYIARLGAPYAPFSEEIKEELGNNGILHIIRTWRFDSHGGFSSR